MIDLPQGQIEIVQAILRKYAGKRHVVAFGSRVRGMAKPYSDLDLCLMGEHPLDIATMASLRNAFSESDLPVKIDIVDWAATEEAFRKIIKAQAVDFPYL